MFLADDRARLACLWGSADRVADAPAFFPKCDVWFSSCLQHRRLLDLFSPFSRMSYAGRLLEQRSRHSATRFLLKNIFCE